MSWNYSESGSFGRRHWRAFVTIASAVAAILAWGVYVLLWFIGNAESSGLVPTTLGLWSFSNLVAFLLYGIFWELLLAGPLLVVAAGAGWVWLKKLPYEEAAGRRFSGHSRSTGGGLSLLIFIAICIKVFLDGKWNVPIASFTLDYVVGSAFIILEWGLITVAIPAALALVWWGTRATKRVESG